MAHHVPALCHWAVRVVASLKGSHVKVKCREVISELGFCFVSPSTTRGTGTHKIVQRKDRGRRREGLGERTTHFRWLSARRLPLWLAKKTVAIARRPSASLLDSIRSSLAQGSTNSKAASAKMGSRRSGAGRDSRSRCMTPTSRTRPLVDTVKWSTQALVLKLDAGGDGLTPIQDARFGG